MPADDTFAAEWHVVTCEYPPRVGGVSDYTRLVAEGLARAGESVFVWCPPGDEGVVEGEGAAGVRVMREAGRFGPKDLRRVGRMLDARTRPRRLLVQYVPHGYGWRAMNLGFCLWLWKRARLSGDRVELMVHEPFLGMSEGGWRHRGAAAVQRLMAALLLRAASRVRVSIPAWGDALRPYAVGRRVEFEWLPVPSTIEACEDAPAVAAARARHASRPGSLLVGHLGTYPRHAVDSLKEFAPRLLARSPEAVVLLMGQGSEEARAGVVDGDASLSERVRATGRLTERELSAHLSACDLVVLPFVDGVSTRRTSAMAALAHGRALVTTEGRLTEGLWGESGAVALVAACDADALAAGAARLLEDAGERERLGARARALYLERFEAAHTVAALRGGRAEVGHTPESRAREGVAGAEV